MIFKILKYRLLFFFLIISRLVLSEPDTFRAITMDNGLSNFLVNSIFKDSTGYVWIGTDNSLNRFDGVDFKYYYFKSGDINKKRILSITEAESGHLYVGNGIGLWKLNNHVGELEPVSPEIIDCGVNSLLWSKSNQKLYVGTTKGLFILDRANNVEFVPLHQNILSLMNSIQGIETGDKDILWITTRSGLCSYDCKSKKIEVFKSVFSSTEQSFFAKLTRIGNTLYIGTSKMGLIEFDILKKEFSKSVDVGSDIITHVASDGKDKVYVSTDGNGVHFISHLQNKIIKSLKYDPKQKNGIRSNSVYSLLVDKNGVIWVGFYQAGLDYSYYQNKIFDIYSNATSFDSEGLPVRAFLINDKIKLIGTREGLYFVDERNNIARTYTKDVLRSNLILSLKYYNGEYYIGTYGGGLSILNPHSMIVRPLNKNFTLSKGHVFHLEEDENGFLWMATSGGLFKYDKKTNNLTAYSNANSQLYAGNVFYIYFDSTQKGWIATENGLCIYDPNTNSIKTNVFPKGFFNNEIIKVIYEDSKNQLFFCPDRGNIYVTDPDMRKFSTFEQTQHFSGRVFLSILEDKNHQYWIGTDHGLLRLNRDDKTYTSYGYIDGIPDPVFSTDASFQDENGRLWFGNAKGLITIDGNRNVQIKKNSFPVIITEFNVNGGKPDEDDMKDFVAKSKIHLNYNENTVNFKFVSLQFTAPSTILYEYKLEGYDEEWKTLPGGQNSVQYDNLPSGNYKMKVRVEGDSNVFAQMEFKIHSFFSFQFWLIVFVIFVFVYFFTNKILHLFRHLKDRITSLSSNQKVIENEENHKNDIKYKYTRIPEDECKLVCDNLYQYIETEKPFTNPDLKIVDLAKALNCSSHTLSYIFNQYLTKNYYDFINEYRVKEFKVLVSASDSSKFTLSALAEQCGFSSRASFFRSFKKLTGITPNEYIRSIGKTLQAMDDESME